MALYNNRFYISYNNDLGEFIEIFLSYKDYIGNVIELAAATDCLIVKNTGGDEDKLYNMCGAEAYVKFIIPQDDTISIDDFISEHDLDIQVMAFMNQQYDRSIFQGFVVVEDNSQPFLDPPYAVTIRALDGLGLLKGVYFLNTEGKPFAGKMSIVQWLCQILYQTGQTLKLRTYFNFRNTNFSNNGNPLEQTFIDAITFQSGSQTPAGDDDPADYSTGFVDYFTALEILARNCRSKLFQENGSWHFVNLFEYIRPGGYTYYEYEIGAPVAGIVTFTQTGAGTDQDYTLMIGRDEIIFPTKEDGMQYLKLAYKSIELVYNYDQAIAKICNQDLSQGEPAPTFDEIINSSIIDPAIQPPVNLPTLGYDAFCWTHLQATTPGFGAPPYPNGPTTKKGFIRQVNDLLGFTVDRFMVIDTDNDDVLSFFRSSQFLVDVGDILQLSFQWRTRQDIHDGSSLQVGYLILYGDDGSTWALRSVGDGAVPGNPTKWELITPFYQAIATGLITDNTAQWTPCGANNNINFTNPPAKTPVSGRCELLLGGLVDSDAGNPLEYWYKDISITLLPYLNGTYKQLKGDYNYSAQTNNIKQTIKQPVEISDSPKRYFKGALFSDANGLVLLPAAWHTPDDSVTNYRFTQLMEYSMYAHTYRQLYKIEGTFKEYVYVEPNLLITRMGGLLNRFTFPNSKWPTKEFMCTSYERDHNTGQWRGVFVETRKDVNDLGLKIPDSFIFAYLFQSS